jgi:AcrR family transcriptional regulator
MSAMGLEISTRELEAPLPPREDVEGTRGRILRAALVLFATRGYHASSIRDVATEAGLGSASLYSHFSSKESILAELVFIGHDEHQRRLMTALLGAGARPRDQLAALVRAHVLSHTEFPVLAIVANRGIRDLSPGAAAPSVALSNHSAALLTEVLERGVAMDGFVVDNGLVVGGVIATMGSSVASWWPSRADLITAEELADGHAMLALRMVGITPDA